MSVSNSVLAYIGCGNLADMVRFTRSMLSLHHIMLSIICTKQGGVLNQYSGAEYSVPQAGLGRLKKIGVNTQIGVITLGIPRITSQSHHASCMYIRTSSSVL